MVNRLFFAAALPVCSQFVKGVNITKFPRDKLLSIIIFFIVYDEDGYSDHLHQYCSENHH